MIRKLLFSILFATSFAFASPVYEFAGKHFIASYLDCNLEAICDVENLLQAMDQAVDLCGATVLNKNHHIFPPNGLTAVYLLSESHASIHTYPECGACFVDLFTCGNNCSAKKFDAILQDYLNPKVVNARFFERNEKIQETTYP